jgi:hypothetical protein
LVVKFCRERSIDLAVSGSESVAKRMREAGVVPPCISLGRLETAVTGARGSPLGAHRPRASRKL